MISQLIVKFNIFDKINDYVSVEVIKKDFEWWNSKIFRSLDISLRITDGEIYIAAHCHNDGWLLHIRIVSYGGYAFFQVHNNLK